MKKYCKFIIFCVLIFSLIFLSCNNILLSKGSSLSIRLPGTEQSRFAFVKPENLDSFTIILTKKNGKTQEKTAKAGETIVFDSLTADTYTVSAKAFDKDNNCAAYAQEEVLIKPKQNTNLVLNLTWNLLTEEAIINNKVDFVVTPPKKTTYTLGEVFDPTGLKVEAVFKNGYRQEIPAQIMDEPGVTTQQPPIYYIINDLTSYKIITTTSSSRVIINNDILFPNGWEVESIPLTLNVPKPTISSVKIEKSADNPNICNIFAELSKEFETLGFEQNIQWYIVENGEDKKLEDSNNTTIAVYPSYSGTTENTLVIDFDDTSEAKTYQYYVEVTYSIPEDYTNQSLPGITYGKTTATTKSKIVTVTTKGSSSGSGATTTPTASYSIGDVYPQNGTPMGVVFEVDADNSYIKIVALHDLSDESGTPLADTGWIDTKDYIAAYDENDGSVNMTAFLTWYNYMSENYALQGFSDELGFYQVNNYENGGWYIPAINELTTIYEDEENGRIAPALQENGEVLTSGLTYWSSTFVSTDTTYETAYAYATFSGKTEEHNVGGTSHYIRPVKKIAL